MGFRVIQRTEKLPSLGFYKKENEVESTNVKKIRGMWVDWPLFIAKSKTY